MATGPAVRRCDGAGLAVVELQFHAVAGQQHQYAIATRECREGAVAVDLGDAPRVGLGEARSALVGLGQQAVGALRAVAVDQRGEVPGDLLHIDEGH